MLLLTGLTVGIYPWFWLARRLRPGEELGSLNSQFTSSIFRTDPHGPAWVQALEDQFLPWWIFGLAVLLLSVLLFIETVFVAVPGWMYAVPFSLVFAGLVYGVFGLIFWQVGAVTMSGWLPLMIEALGWRERALGDVRPPRPRALVHMVTTVPTLGVAVALVGSRLTGMTDGPMGGEEVALLTSVGAVALVVGYAYVGYRLQRGITRVARAEREGRLEPVETKSSEERLAEASLGAVFEVVDGDAQELDDRARDG